ncbi:MAG: hypothetical protein BWY78_00702 [Alphaproteobacteria bacterium ADurb.Bin438]|nr:MAG: hypothetical protein BWY78_00702 [Alphaproteobacteria bacterium ADurb.Bin438]
MKILMLGDVVGKVGRDILINNMPILRRDLNPDFIIVNGENASHGYGITPSICQSFFEVGVDVVTTGNHVWDRKEIVEILLNDKRVLRPLNLAKDSIGRGYSIYEKNGKKIAVMLVLGNIFMSPAGLASDSVLDVMKYLRLKENVDAIVVDFHADATSEKYCMGHLLDGRVTLVAGTHTHIPTADLHILEKGTAFICDLGMCGCYDSVIGMKKDGPVARFTNSINSHRFEPASGNGTICGVLVETEDKTGLAKNVKQVIYGATLKTTI